MKDISEFVCILKERLDTLLMKQKYNENNLLLFYKSSVFSDQSATRDFFYIPFYTLTLIILTFIGIYISLSMGVSKYYLVLGFILRSAPYLYFQFGIY